MKRKSKRIPPVPLGIFTVILVVIIVGSVDVLGCLALAKASAPVLVLALGALTRLAYALTNAVVRVLSATRWPPRPPDGKGE